MTHDQLEAEIRRIVGAALRQGERQEREQLLPHIRIKAAKDLLREMLELIRRWDNGREWHEGPVSTTGKWNK